MMFGTTQPTFEAFMHEDVDLIYASIRAFNRWLVDDWGFAYKNRIYAGATMSLLDLDRAVAELEWLLEQGVRPDGSVALPKALVPYAGFGRILPDGTTSD